MRIVRFHLEPWQRNGSLSPSPAPSPSLKISSPLILRRQRIPNLNVCQNCYNKEIGSSKMLIVDRPARKLRNRYSIAVKKLSILCSDVIARNVCLIPIFIIRSIFLMQLLIILIVHSVQN